MKGETNNTDIGRKQSLTQISADEFGREKKKEVCSCQTKEDFKLGKTQGKNSQDWKT